MPITSFSEHFAVYKRVNTSRCRTEHWAGVLTDRKAKTVVWDNDTRSTYGDCTTETDNPTFYTDASLADDMAVGKLLYNAVEMLVNGNQPPKLPPNHPLAKAMEEARACYPKPGSAATTKPKKPWLVWLEGCIIECQTQKVSTQTVATGKLV